MKIKLNVTLNLNKMFLNISLKSQTFLEQNTQQKDSENINPPQPAISTLSTSIVDFSLPTNKHFPTFH